MKKSLIVVALLAITEITFAQWSNDSTINTPICIFSGNQTLSDIISDGEGGAIIVWEDYRGSSLDIYAQRINSAGVVQWVTDGTPISNASGHQRYPEIIGDGEGGAIIVWADERNGFVDIFAQKINSAGTIQWAADGIAVYVANNTKSDIGLASDGSGGVIISWSDTRDPEDNVYAQRILSTGVLSWNSLGVPICTAGNEQVIPAIAGDGIGGAFIVWQDYRSLVHVYAQHIDSNGQVQWTTNGKLICGNAAAEQVPAIVSDNLGNAIIVWQDMRNTYRNLYAQKVDISGTLIWNSDGIPISIIVGQQSVQNVVSDGNGGAIVTWRDHRGNSEDIYAQKIDNSGNVQWTANGLPVCTAAEDQMQPDMIVTSEGEAIITWYDSRFPYNPDIYAQKISGNGITKWDNNGIKISANNKIQGEAEIIYDGSLGAIITWNDNRNNNGDIYAQQIDQNGHLGLISDVTDEYIGIDQFKLKQNYPNPFNPTTKIKFAVPEKSNVLIKVYDILGSEVITLVNEEMDAGWYENNFNAAGLSSGVYLFRMEAGNFISTKKMIYLR